MKIVRFVLIFGLELAVAALFFAALLLAGLLFSPAYAGGMSEPIAEYAARPVPRPVLCVENREIPWWSEECRVIAGTDDRPHGGGSGGDGGDGDGDGDDGSDDPSDDPGCPKPDKPRPDKPKNGNNGWGNGDQDAPGNSEHHNNAENAGGNHNGSGDRPGRGRK